MTGLLRVASIVLGMFVLVTGLTAGARAVARLAPPPSVHLETGDCQPPCWEGIQPGSSSRYAVERQTYKWFDNPAAFFSSPYSATMAGLGDYLELFTLHTFGSGLSAGKVLRVPGPPDAISCIHGLPAANNRQTSRSVSPCFNDRQGEVSVIMDEGQEWVQAAYRDNYPRLAEIKKKYDPTNLFHVKQNIELAL